MRARLWLGVILSGFALTTTAAVPRCPPSLEAPLEEAAPGTGLLFPRGHLFQPLIADPLEPRFFTSYHRNEKSGREIATGEVGAGETFPLWRAVGVCATEGWQLDVTGGGVARFVLEDERNDLIDGSFTIGVPVSWRRGQWAWRARAFHNSSHLGEDSFYRGTTPPRSRTSYESIDFLVGYDEAAWRIYGGAEYMRHHFPRVKPWGLHLGAEYYGARTLFGGLGRWIGGLDVKLWDEYDYQPDYSAKLGLSLGGRRPAQQNLQLLLEWYDGHENRGVFFDDKVRYVGVGVAFGF